MNREQRRKMMKKFPKMREYIKNQAAEDVKSLEEIFRANWAEEHKGGDRDDDDSDDNYNM
jgi:hypothetical protein